MIYAIYLSLCQMKFLILHCVLIIFQKITLHVIYLLTYCVCIAYLMTTGAHLVKNLMIRHHIFIISITGIKVITL